MSFLSLFFDLVFPFTQELKSLMGAALVAGLQTQSKCRDFVFLYEEAVQIRVASFDSPIPHT